MEFYGKKKCRILKQIRAEIAKNNDIDWVIEECPHKGECKGTCPKCEEEVRELERQLAARRNLGKTIALTGVAAGIALAVSGCGGDTFQPLEGDVANPDANTSVTDSADGESGDQFVLMGDVAYFPGEDENDDGKPDDFQPADIPHGKEDDGGDEDGDDDGGDDCPFVLEGEPLEPEHID